MLKISKNIESTTQLGKDRVEVDDNNKAKRDGKCKFDKIRVNNNEGGDKKDDEIGKKGQKCLSLKICLSPKK